MVFVWFPWFFMVVSRFLDQRSSVGYPCPWRDVFGLKQVSWILLLVNVPETQKRSSRNTKMQKCKSFNSVVQPTWFSWTPLLVTVTFFASKEVSWILLLVNVPEMLVNVLEMQKRSYRNTKVQLHKSFNSVVQPDSDFAPKEVGWIPLLVTWRFCTKMYLTELNPGPTIPI